MDELPLWGSVELRLDVLMLSAQQLDPAPTQPDIIKRLDISAMTFHRLLYNQSESINPTHLARIMALFGVSLDRALVYVPPAGLLPPPPVMLPTVHVAEHVPETVGTIDIRLLDVLGAYFEVFHERLTYEQLSSAIGISPDRISDLAHGRQARLDRTLLARLITYFARILVKDGADAQAFIQALLARHLGIGTITMLLGYSEPD